MKKYTSSMFLILALSFLLITPLTAQETPTPDESAGEITDSPGGLPARFIAADTSFSIPLPPSDWTNASTPDMAHYINPAESFEIYAFAVESDDLESGITAARQQLFPDAEAVTVQSNTVPLPNGLEWTQDVAIVQIEGQPTLVAVLAYFHEGRTFVMVAVGTQASFAASVNVINSILLNYAITGAGFVYEAPEYADEASFTEEDVTIVTGEYELPGTLTLPIRSSLSPVVVLVHGSGPSDRDERVYQNAPFKDLAWGLASQGVAVLRYDKRTKVYQEADAGFTIMDETVDDAVSAVQYLVSDPRIDPNRIYVLGHSLGGYAAPRIAANSEEVDGLILLAAPARDMLDIMQEQYEFLATLPVNQGPEGEALITQQLAAIEEARSLTPESKQDFILNAPVSYWLDMQEYDQVEVAQSLDLPMLVLNAGNDYQVTETDYQLWQDALDDRDNVTFMMFEGLYHLFIEGPRDSAAYQTQGHVAVDVVNTIAEWVKAQ